MREFVITPPDEGRTLYSLLRNAMPTAPRSFLRRLPRGGAVTLGGEAPDLEVRLHTGDVVRLRESLRVMELLFAGPCPLDILYDDEDVLVLNKAAGLAVHPTEDADADDLLTLAEPLAPALGHRDAYHVINRLDRWTSGVVLLAWGAVRANAFAWRFQGREVDKRYVALVAGQPPDRGTIRLPVDGRPSSTGYAVLARGNGTALVLAHPRTGRRHQIRQHLASIGHPLLGDRRYGGPPFPGVQGALLHAVFLAIPHPGTGARLSVLAPVPRHFLDAMDAAGLPAGTHRAMLDAAMEPAPPG